jgi:hypothetical protein
MEHFVAIGSGIGSLGNTTKAVQIELPLKGSQLGVAKVLR